MNSLLHPNSKHKILHTKVGEGVVPYLLDSVHKDPIIRGGQILRAGESLGTTNRIVGNPVNPKTANHVSNTTFPNQPVRLGGNLVQNVKNLKPVPKEEGKKKRNNIKMVF